MKEYKTIREILDDLISREIGKSEAEKVISEFMHPKPKMANIAKTKQMEVVAFQDMRGSGQYDEVRLVLRYKNKSEIGLDRIGDSVTLINDNDFEGVSTAF